MNSLYQNLNEKQREAVNYLEGPLLIVAGAGSGKTKTLTSRLAAILASGAAPENIIAITFTNKAAEEMKNRVSKLMEIGKSGNWEKSPFIGTFHSLGARILKKEARLLGRNANFSIFDKDDSLRLIKIIIKSFNLSEKERKNLSPAMLSREFSRIKNELSNPEHEEENIQRLFSEYESALEANNAFDFDDLIEKPVRLFQKYKNILEKYQNQFRYILVDEFQDTNMSQYNFIKLLAQEHKNLSVVGDDSQSIYKFRGSDFRNFLNFENDWPKTKVVLLEQNYRSAGNIIKAASGLIKNNKLQKPKNLWTENDDGEMIKIVEHKGEDEEGRWIADKVNLLISELVDWKNQSINQPINQSTNIAILYRTNAQSRAIESALIERGIGYQIFGGIKFYERKEIKDIVAALRWGFNQNDSVSLGRLESNLLKRPFMEIKNNLPQMIEKLSPAELISFFLEKASYFEQLRKNYPNFQERIENINELIYFAGGFEELADFLEAISLFQSGDTMKNDKSEADSPAGRQKSKVFLMTVHLAKGLEFDSVFIIGCNEGLLPHQMSYSDDLEIEEERRLMYVAMTRAKKELFINFYNLPSRFLLEIPPELVKYIGNQSYDSFDDEERYITID